MKETLFEDLLYYEGNEGSQKAGKIGSFKRNAFRRGPELTQELASVFSNCHWVFHSCDGFDGLSLFSLAAPSRSNKDKYCLVKSSFLNYLEVGCHLRNCSTETKKVL